MLDAAAPEVAELELPDPIGVVVPHAGYRYSGPTAARAFALVRGRGYKRVIVVAPSHYAFFSGGSIFEGDAFDTPLGPCPLDNTFIAHLRREHSMFGYWPEAERREHSLEVQLPFIKRTLGDVLLVPVVVAEQTADNMTEVADALSKALDLHPAKTLIVASSDLYHGPGVDVARERSGATARAVGDGDAAKFLAGIERGDYQACGGGPIALVLQLARLRGEGKVRVLKVTTSFDEYPVSDDYVVGYMSAAAW